VRREGQRSHGRFQCDASDRRQVVLPNGKSVTTTCLRIDDFDLVAVNLYAFTGEWRFAFARNRDLPRTAHKAYTAYQRKHLLASLVPIDFPLQAPFRKEPFGLLGEILEERRRARRSKP